MLGFTMAINLIGFDSAWSDQPKVPGAICGLRTKGDGTATFHAPTLVGFAEARVFVQSLHAPGDMTLVAIDQPTIVRNQTGMRPAERVVAGTMSWSGGGIQPAYRDKASMFGDGAPIWLFLDALGFTDDPERAATARSGGYVMEVYPALALLSLDDRFASAGKRGPRYNPARPTFRQDDWGGACDATEREAVRLGLPEAAAWCAGLDRAAKPRKAMQDRLDAILCLLIAARWRADRSSCAMIGDRAAGYIVAPMGDVVRKRLCDAASGTNPKVQIV